MIGKLKKKCNEVGLKNMLVGSVKVLYYKRLQKRFDFPSWHLSPYELREYAQITAQYINKNNPDKVVDIGCGLGEILRRVKAKEKLGLDLSETCISAAKYLNRKNNGVFEQGSFDQLKSENKIDYLITLNFMHGSPEEVWRPIYHKVCEINDIRHIIADSVKETDNVHRLDFEKILPSEYKLQDTFGPLLGERYLYVYEKVDV